MQIEEGLGVLALRNCAEPGKFRGVAPVACNGFGNGHGHISAGLQPVNEGVTEHVHSNVQVPHVLVQRGWRTRCCQSLMRIAASASRLFCLTTRFLSRKMQEYEALKLEIEALRSEVDVPGQDKSQKA